MLLGFSIRTGSSCNVKIEMLSVILNRNECICTVFLSNGGGGGERVLWILVAAMLTDKELSKRTQIVIYTADTVSVTAQDTLRRVKDKFSIDISNEGDAERIKFVHIKTAYLLEAARFKSASTVTNWTNCVSLFRYPRFTMLMQSLGSIIVGLECILRLTPHVYFDTMGAAFTYPAARLLASCRVLAYVHYPIISQVEFCCLEALLVIFDRLL